MDNNAINSALNCLQSINRNSILVALVFNLLLSFAIMFSLTIVSCFRSYFKGMRKDFKDIKSDLAVTLKPDYLNDLILAVSAIIGVGCIWFLINNISKTFGSGHLAYIASLISISTKKVDAQVKASVLELHRQYKIISITCGVSSLVFQLTAALIYFKYLLKHSEVFSLLDYIKFTKTEAHRSYVEKKFLTTSISNLVAAPAYTFDPIDSLASSVTREVCEMSNGLKQVEGCEKDMIAEELEENGYTSYCYIITTHNNYQESQVTIHLFSSKDTPKSQILYVKDIQEVLKNRAKMEVFSEVLKSEYVKSITMFDANRSTICLKLTPKR